MFPQGNLRPEEALQSLTIYEGNFGRLKVEREKCARAKEALELTDTGLLSGSEERVQVRQQTFQLKHWKTPTKDKVTGSQLFWFDLFLSLWQLVGGTRGAT